MLLNPVSLKHHLAAANRGRYTLNCIALMPQGTLSTDGHALLFAPYPDQDPKDAPKIDGVDPGSPPPQVEPLLLSIPDAAKAANMVGKTKRFAPPITTLLQAEIKGDAITFGATDLSNAQTMRVQRMEGAFPDVAVVIPDYGKAVTTTVNIDQLLRTLKALRGSTSEDVVTIRIIDDQQAIGLSCKGGVCAITMPIQVEKPEDHVPDQLAKLRDGPPVAAPAEPDKSEPEEREDWQPTEAEVEEATDAFKAVAPLPAPATHTKRRRRHKAAASPQAELQEILSGA